MVQKRNKGSGQFHLSDLPVLSVDRSWNQCFIWSC
jgi:hypothetical protein